TFDPSDSTLSCKTVNSTANPADEAAWFPSFAKVVSYTDGRVTEIWGSGSTEAEAKEDLQNQLSAKAEKAGVTYRCPAPISPEKTPHLGVDFSADWEKAMARALTGTGAHDDRTSDLFRIEGIGFFSFDGKWDSAESSPLTAEATEKLAQGR